jgi:hypothetical protein
MNSEKENLVYPANVTLFWEYIVTLIVGITYDSKSHTATIVAKEFANKINGSIVFIT